MASRDRKCLTGRAIHGSRDDRPLSACRGQRGRTPSVGACRKQAKNGRAGARHRRVPRARPLERTNEAANLRMSLRDDGLEVVGHAPRRERDAFRRACSARLMPSRSISIEPSKRLLSADAERGDCEQHPCARGIDEREQQIATLQSQHGAAFKKIRHVSAQRRPDGANAIRIHAPQTAERSQRRRRIAAATAQSSLHRNSLRQVNRQVAGRAATSGRLPDMLGGAPNQIAPIGRTRRVIARQLKHATSGADRERVVQRNRLKDRAQLVEAIRPNAKDFERTVDLRKRADARQRPSDHGPSAHPAARTASVPRRRCALRSPARPRERLPASSGRWARPATASPPG